MLNILANVATGSRAAVAEARTALQGVSEWFDEYMAQEETTGGQVRNLIILQVFIHLDHVLS